MSTKDEEIDATNIKNDPLDLERRGIVREVGNQAVWSLSSCKPGKKGLALILKKHSHNF